MNHDDEELLANLLIVWEKAQSKSIHLTVDDLCGRTPHLKPELQRRIHALKATAWMAPSATPKRMGPSKDPAQDLGARPLWKRYQLGNLIGESPTSNVWCGFDVELHRVVAIKVLKQEHLGISEDFLAAARQQAALHHPGIVQIHDISALNIPPFVVLDFVERGSLKQLLLGNANLQQAIQWTIQLAETLEFMHRAGIIHQNLKPDNILIDKSGHVMLSDPGVSRKTSELSTISSWLLKTPYMAPEQLASELVGPATDIYSLAVVFHEMATGKLPFIPTCAETPGHAPFASPIEISTRLPRELSDLLMRSLATNPADRPASAAAFAEELKSLTVGNPTRRSLLPLLACSTVAAASGLFIWVRNKPILSSTWYQRIFQASAQQQLKLITAALTERNPAFNGHVRGILEHGKLTGLDFCSDTVTDISPIASLTKLKTLKMSGTFHEKAHGKLVDIAPLRDMELERLEIFNNEFIQSIEPLANMPLDHLNISRTSVSDLGPLAGSPLKTCVAGTTAITSLTPLADTLVSNLWFDHTAVHDISFMRTMSLQIVYCHHTPVEYLDSVSGLPLISLDCHNSSVRSIEPFSGMETLQTLNFLFTRVTDLSPLLKIPNLKYLWCEFDWQRDGGIIRKLNRLEKLNDLPLAELIREQDNNP